MARRKHWSEFMSCQCGMRFRSYKAEAFHRHNFPLLCRRRKVKDAKAVKNSTEVAKA